MTLNGVMTISAVAEFLVLLGNDQHNMVGFSIKQRPEVATSRAAPCPSAHS